MHRQETQKKNIAVYNLIGLDANKVKLIALLSMTIDHIGVYGFETPFVRGYYSVIRYIGRIAAPLFLFMLIESIRHCQSMSRFAVKIYLAAIFTGIIYAITNYYKGGIDGVYTPGNILFSYFYVIIFCSLYNKAKSSDCAKRFYYLISAIIIVYFPKIIFDAVKHYHFGLSESFVINHPQSYQLLDDLFNSLICPIQYVEYSWIFVLLGVLLYIFPTRKTQILIFSLFSCLSYLGSTLHLYTLYCADFFSNTQFFMILSIPIYAIYNGDRGRKTKVFYYLYYPIHQTLLRILFAFA